MNLPLNKGKREVDRHRYMHTSPHNWFGGRRQKEAIPSAQVILHLCRESITKSNIKIGYLNL
jgi:hypothetical protein